MKLTVTSRHVRISEADRSEIAEKIDHLDRVLNGRTVSASCVIDQQRQQFVCDVTVHMRGNHLVHGQGRDARLASAAGAAVGKVCQQAQRRADRWKTKRRRSAGRSAPSAPLPEAGASVAARRVIRSRGYAAKPMTVADAALLFEAGRAPVLVFREAASGAVSVLFRRPDGHLGLIESDV